LWFDEGGGTETIGRMLRLARKAIYRFLCASRFFVSLKMARVPEPHNFKYKREKGQTQLKNGLKCDIK
jgi:hypothetical protein